MAGLGLRPFQHLDAPHSLQQQRDAAGGLSSGGRAASGALSAEALSSAASTDTAGMEQLTASRGHSLCSAPDYATEEEDLLSRELTREILLEEYGSGGDPAQPGSSRRSSQRASRHASSEPLCEEFEGLMARYEEEEEEKELGLSLYDQVGGGVVMKVRSAGGADSGLFFTSSFEA